MATYGLEGVIARWEAGKLTKKQALGQILLLLREMEERLKKLENRIAEQSRQ